jgi:hypothetical protein
MRPEDSTTSKDEPVRQRVPLALVPDRELLLLRRLRLPSRLAGRVRQELELRRGSDRSGPRIAVTAMDVLEALETASVTVPETASPEALEAAS